MEQNPAGVTPAVPGHPLLLSRSLQYWLQPLELQGSHEVCEGGSDGRKSRELRVGEGVCVCVHVLCVNALTVPNQWTMVNPTDQPACLASD